MSFHTSVRLPSRLPSLQSPKTTYLKTQTRNATLLRRPKRPYTFTQLITLTDGSTFQTRTTSPFPLVRTTRDTRNAPLWNPSSLKLVNLEVDEAGRLAAFRAKFGRSWDSNSRPDEEEEGVDQEKDGGKANKKEKKGKDGGEEMQRQDAQEEDDNLLDLISSFGQEIEQAPRGGKDTGRKK